MHEVSYENVHYSEIYGLNCLRVRQLADISILFSKIFMLQAIARDSNVLL